MLDTITGTISSIIGITVLVVSGYSILYFFITSTFIQKILKTLSLAFWAFYIFGLLFFRLQIEIVFVLVIFIFVPVAFVCGCIWLARQYISRFPQVSPFDDPEIRCAYCIYYEECVSIHKEGDPDCTDFTPREDVLQDKRLSKKRTLFFTPKQH